MTTNLKQLINGTPYLNYLYSYPHKTAYRPLESSFSVEELWAKEDKSSLFLYLHIPFCEMRCGFCNLFTTANPKASLVTEYLDQLEQQAIQVSQSLGDYHIANIAIGGGTPTYLTTKELTRLFNIIQNTFHVDLQEIPIGIETSPATVSAECLQVLKDHHVNRISIGVESFALHETKAMGRPQKTAQVQQALELIQQANFDALNIDLIYGAEGQSIDSWLESVQRAVDYQAEEIYLYPLYVRPLTGLGRKGQQDWDDQRFTSYTAARDLLQDQGYEQISMRMFRQSNALKITKGEYHCQEDGMIGLGCGARSYTRAMHYSSDYAVKRQGVLDIIQAYLSASPTDLTTVNYGIQLNQDEQQRRYILMSLLQCEGLDRLAYQRLYHTDAMDDYPQLHELLAEHLATANTERLRLNKQGIAYSDVIGTWLFSPTVSNKMTDYSCR